MTRRRLSALTLIAVAIVAGWYWIPLLPDTTFPAQVVGTTQYDMRKGPVLWQLVVARGDGETLTLSAGSKQPALKDGDVICVASGRRWPGRRRHWQTLPGLCDN